MALVYTGPADIDFDPESVDTVITNTFTTAASDPFVSGAGNFGQSPATVQLDVVLQLDQDFITPNQTHPDAFAGDLTVKAIFTDDEGTATPTTIVNGDSNKSIGTLGSSGNHTVGFEVTGLEEGCELTISYNLENNGDSKDGETCVIGVESVKGLNGCSFQDELKYQQLNQKLNGRFDADTKEFSSFKDMLKRIKRVK